MSGRRWGAEEVFDIGWSDERKCQACHEEEGTETHRLYHCPSAKQAGWHAHATKASSSRLRARRTKNTVHVLKTRFDEFVEREFVHAQDMQTALLLLADKLLDKLMDRLSDTLLATVTKLTNSLDARYETLSSRVQTMWMTRANREV